MQELLHESWQPSAGPVSLKLRSEVLWKLRSLFHEHGFLEVHTPLLSADTVLDRHIDPIVVDGRAIGYSPLSDSTLYLQTSPEFAMKRLLASGLDKIYQISSVFRSGERGQYHNPEFCMLEWYRAGDGMVEAVEFLKEIVRTVLPHSQPTTLGYRDAFEEFVGICPIQSSIEDFARAARQHDLQLGTSWGDDRDEWLNVLFAEVIQPRLGIEHPAIVTHYPASQSALACISPDDPQVAERFELFIDGIELANGYHELLCPRELDLRNQTTARLRLRDGKPDLQPSGRLLAAMQAGLPACSGCALGLDRLLMVLIGASSIDEVICFPIERA